MKNLFVCKYKRKVWNRCKEKKKNWDNSYKIKIADDFFHMSTLKLNEWINIFIHHSNLQ